MTALRLPQRLKYNVWANSSRRPPPAPRVEERPADFVLEVVESPPHSPRRKACLPRQVIKPPVIYYVIASFVAGCLGGFILAAAAGCV